MSREKLLVCSFAAWMCCRVEERLQSIVHSDCTHLLIGWLHALPRLHQLLGVDDTHPLSPTMSSDFGSHALHELIPLTLIAAFVRQIDAQAVAVRGTWQVQRHPHGSLHHHKGTKITLLLATDRNTVQQRCLDHGWTNKVQ